ncbi:MAG: gas vesicle protein GvpFL [Actinophytocola sp.]|nr:gas vesicle protein GvpFL [Actinophytocola sp.]
MTEDMAVWLYAVTPEPAPAGLTELTGVLGAPVRVVRASGLAAVVSSVSRAEVGEEPLRRNLEDLDWLAATATGHDAVVGAVTSSATAVPVRIATVYHGDDRVRDVLTEHRTAFAATVDLLAGRTEWGVKAYAASNHSDESADVPGDAPAGTSGGAPGDVPGDAPGSGAPGGGQRSGTAYLLRRRAQLRARETADHLAARDADRVHTELGSLAVAVRRHPPQHSRLTGTRANMVLNAAYLVDDARAEHFATAVTELDARGPLLHLYLTGPWPPYSFSRIAEVTT